MSGDHEGEDWFAAASADGGLARVRRRPRPEAAHVPVRHVARRWPDDGAQIRPAAQQRDRGKSPSFKSNIRITIFWISIQHGI